MTTCPGPRGNSLGMRKRTAAGPKGATAGISLISLFFLGAKGARAGGRGRRTGGAEGEGGVRCASSCESWEVGGLQDRALLRQPQGGERWHRRIPVGRGQQRLPPGAGTRLPPGRLPAAALVLLAWAACSPMSWMWLSLQADFVGLLSPPKQPPSLPSFWGHSRQERAAWLALGL